MNSKERVLATLAHAVADRVPINYQANGAIHARLCKHFGIGANDGEALRRILGVDFRNIDVPYTGVSLHAEVPGRRVDACWGPHTRWIDHESGGYWDFFDFPLRDATVEDVAAWPMPNPDDFDYSHVREWTLANREYALYVGGPGLADCLNATGMIRNYEQVLIDIITDDPAGLLYMDRRLDVMLETTRRTLEAARGGVDFVWMGEDLGTQHAPLISMETYRKHLKPRHQKVIDLAKSFNLPVMIHTCGSSSWVYEEMIGMGIDAVDTLQPEAANMSPGYLKKTLGNRLTYHGCISTAGALVNGTPDDVEAECRQTLDIMMPGGGYCFAPTHAIQDNSPTENVVRMYECAHRLGQYA